MRILLIGGTGTIGRKVNKHLAAKHEIITVGKSSGDFQVNIGDSKSIEALFVKTGKVDAIICITGEAKWASFDAMTEEDFYIGIKSKLMGQVNLTRIGMKHLNDKGSITLTTGILAEHPVPLTTSAAMVNGAIHSFVMALAKEDHNGIRVNVVAAALVEDSAEKYAEYFKGQPIVSMKEVAEAYESCVEGSFNGHIVKVY